MITKKAVRLLLLGAAASLLPASAALAAGPYQFFSVPPCRIVDTRGNGFTGLFGPPSLVSVPPSLPPAPRNFPIRGQCGIPTTATAAVLNVTFVGPTAAGHISIWPFGSTMPNVSTVNAAAGEPAIANGAIVPLAADPSLQISVQYVATTATPTTNLVIDVTGYFQ
jgi:hypothetical protein